MTSHPEALYRGVSHAAWGYLFLYLDVNLGTVSILPAFAGYLLFWSAIGALEGEVRDLSLLRPLCALLGAWAGAGWLYSWTGGSLDGRFYPLDVILQAASLYFCWPPGTSRRAQTWTGICCGCGRSRCCFSPAWPWSGPSPTCAADRLRGSPSPCPWPACW